MRISVDVSTMPKINLGNLLYGQFFMYELEGEEQVFLKNFSTAPNYCVCTSLSKNKVSHLTPYAKVVILEQVNELRLKIKE